MTARKSAAKAKVLVYADIKKLALSLGLPGVTEAVSWGQPCLKVNGKLWFFWSPSENAPVFKVPFEERDMLVETDPETFFITPHYRAHQLVLARPERIDKEWISANLARVWRQLAPKRMVTAWDAEHGE
jgi:hypothetical protein